MSGDSDARAYLKEGAQLAANHLELVKASEITPEVSRSRGYRTIWERVRLKEKGFSEAQRRVPGLLIPIFNHRGELAGYQLRPDEPRVKDGKAIKYETAAGMKMALDCNPLARGMLDDPKIPLFVTEGVRKGDSAVSIGLCCIALLGVWNWRGSNERGGKTALADWESIALNAREVYLVFDSDVTLKREVHAALARLKRFLESHGAVVKIVYLSAGPHGEKIGLDDFIKTQKVAGKSEAQIREELLALAIDDLRQGETKGDTGVLLEEAIQKAEENSVAARGAQYVDPNGRLVHAIPLGSQLAIVRSDGTIDVIEEPEGAALPTRSTFSTAGLRRYAAAEEIGIGEVLDRIVTRLTAHVAFSHRWQPELIALWIFGTFTHVLFAWYGYLHLKSTSKRCGKSLTLNLLSMLGFNATPIGATPSVAFVFRDCARNSSCQIFDEVERLGEADKETAAALMAVLNAGFMRGARVPRVLDPKTDTLVEFPVYGPKALASIRALAGTTADRTIRIELARKKPATKLRRFNTRTDLGELGTLRDDAHIAALRHAEQIGEFYGRADELPIPKELDDRARDILEPLFSIAAVADAERDQARYVPTMQAAALEIAGIRDDADREEETIVAALRVLNELDFEDGIRVLTTKEAIPLFQKAEGLEWITNPASAQWILRQLGFRSSSNRWNGEMIRGYKIAREKVDEMLAVYDPPISPVTPVTPVGRENFHAI